ncbi:MAG: isoprenylcysteine carboxylmethyltransferase family protein [Planctomycetales bacterium]|nr:isoprenylcysteine carboxylmethyltransferase family protein [Planctomycetales bacterium]
MGRFAIFVYAVASYAIGMASLVYMVAWLGNFWVPNAIDAPAVVNVQRAAIVNSLLFGAFAIQHSVMARPWFKSWWTRIVPKPAERATYVLTSGLALFALMLLWQPLGGIVWNVETPLLRTLLYAGYGIGWAILVSSTFCLCHFDLFGLRQAWLHFTERPHTPLSFATPGFYRFVRHPIYVGWITLAWLTPTMTISHLAFAVATSVYILLAIRWEERDLVAIHGDDYERFRLTTPMLIPRFSRAPVVQFEQSYSESP